MFESGIPLYIKETRTFNIPQRKNKTFQYFINQIILQNINFNHWKEL